jgi:hypothetical protein
MSDDEIKGMAAAVKNLLDARDLTTRAEMADLRSTCESLQAELQDLRAKMTVLPSALREQTGDLMRAVADKLGDALPPAIESAAMRIFERRAAELSQRAEPGATQ